MNGKLIIKQNFTKNIKNQHIKLSIIYCKDHCYGFKEETMF